MTTEPGTTVMPTDAELIALLRQRVHRLEGAIGAYFDSVQEINTAVGTPWDALCDAMARDGRDKVVRRAMDAFVVAYKRSLPHRHDALTALHAAVVEDFRQAVLTAPDMSEAQRAKWVALCDAEDAQKGANE